MAVGPTNTERIRNTAVMYGTGSPQPPSGIPRASPHLRKLTPGG